MGLVLISHSGSLVEGLRDMVAQVAGDDVPSAIAGGTEDGRLGTSAPRIAAALRSTLDAGADGVARPARPRQRGAQPRARARGSRPGGPGPGPRQRGAARRGRDPRRRPGEHRRRRIDEVEAAAAAAATMPKIPRA